MSKGAGCTKDQWSNIPSSRLPPETPQPPSLPVFLPQHSCTRDVHTAPFCLSQNLPDYGQELVWSEDQWVYNNVILSLTTEQVQAHAGRNGKHKVSSTVRAIVTKLKKAQPVPDAFLHIASEYLNLKQELNNIDAVPKSSRTNKRIAFLYRLRRQVDQRLKDSNRFNRKLHLCSV